MPLSIVPWQRPDTDWVASAVQHAAQLQQQKESMAQQLAQDNARQRQHEEQLDFNRKQEERIARNQEFKQAQDAAALGVKQAQSGALNTARINELGRRHTGSSSAGGDFPELPMPTGAGPLDGVTEAAPAEAPSDTSPSQQLTMLANQGDNSALADAPLSLGVQNPFANTTDFAGVSSAPDERPIVQTDGADGLLAPQELAPPASMAEQLASMGGAEWPHVEPNPNNMPTGPMIGADPDANPLLPAMAPSQGGLQKMSDMLGADAVARINGARAAGGPKLASATLKAELSQVRKPAAAGSTANLQRVATQDGGALVFNPKTGKYSVPELPEGVKLGAAKTTHQGAGLFESAEDATAKAKELSTDQVTYAATFFPSDGKWGLKSYSSRSNAGVQVAAEKHSAQLDRAIETARKEAIAAQKQMDSVDDTKFAGTTGLDPETGVIGFKDKPAEKADSKDIAAYKKFTTAKYLRDQAQARVDDLKKQQAAANDISTKGVQSKHFSDDESAPAADDKVMVTDPKGRKGKIPKSQLEEALKAGYTAL